MLKENLISFLSNINFPPRQSISLTFISVSSGFLIFRVALSNCKPEKQKKSRNLKRNVENFLNRSTAQQKSIDVVSGELLYDFYEPGGEKDQTEIQAADLTQARKFQQEIANSYARVVLTEFCSNMRKNSSLLHFAIFLAILHLFACQYCGLYE